MPKKVFKLDKFDGGLNNNALPRDIALDEVADINNLMVDEFGQIRTMGTFQDHAAADTQITDFTVQSAYNIFSYSTDFDASGNDTGEDWIVFADSNQANGAYIYANSSDTQAYANVLSTSSNTGAKLVFFNVDGRLYVNDSVFANNPTLKAREYIKATYFSGVDGARTVNSWTDSSYTLSNPSQDAKVAFNGNPTVASGSVQHPLIRIDTGGTGGWDITGSAGNIDIFYSYILRDGSETQLEEFSKSFSSLPVTDKELTFKLWITVPSNHGSISSTIADNVKGMRIYWKGISSAFENSHQLIYDIDFEKGYKIGTSTYYSQNYEDFSQNSDIGSGNDIHIPEIIFSNPTDIANVTYETINGMTPDDVISFIRYKTALVTNRRTYIGNVRYQDAGQTKTFGDKVLKSAVNKFAMFSPLTAIEVSVDDGDEITALSEYADRLLIFKKKKMELVNISKEFEFLEDIFIGKGCDGQFAVAKTDFGITWVNENGCFLYNGRNVINLLEEGKRKLIKDSTWQAFIGTEPLVGYAPKNRNIFVFSTSASSNDDMYIYNIPTRSWVRGDAGTTGIKSNMLVDYNQDLCILDGESGASSAQLKKWNNDSQNQNITLVTKDIDFQQPATKKHVRKVSISYVCSGGDRPTVTFDTNGGTDLNSSFSTSLGTQSDFTTIELKPSSSVRNVNSFQLKINGNANAAFKLSDISIIYREKSPR